MSESEPQLPDKVSPPRLAPGWYLFALVVLALPVYALLTKRHPPEIYGPAPRFELVDQTGETFEATRLADTVSIFDFVFTRCPDVCPLLSTKARWVVDTLDAGKPLRSEIRMVSITVDPDYDTPAVLAEYAARYEADPARWHFLTGPSESIDRVVAGFDQYLERVAEEDGPPSIVHSERFVLVDGDGAIRGFYRSDEEGLTELVADARALAGTWW